MIGRLRGLAANLPAYLRVFGWRGLMSFARVRYSASREPRAVFLRGHAHPVWIRPDSTDVMTLREIFIARDYDFPVHREIRTIIDAGANIGLSTVFFAHKYPRARVVAIEPEAANFALLQQNTRGYANVVALHAALWSETGEVALDDPGRGEHGFVTREAGPTGDITHVEAVTISDVMERQALDHVDLLKVDIEGAEKEVFEQAGRWIGHVSVVVAELHDRFKPGCEAAFLDATRDLPHTAYQGNLVMKSAA